MTREEFDLFLLGSSILCLIMALFNALRAKSRGISGFLMSGAFLAVGGALMLHRANADTALVTLVGVVAFVLLVADLMVRAKNQVLKEPRK